MGARLERLWTQLAAFFLAQPPVRRVVVAGVGVLSMAAVLGLAWWVQRPIYRPLFTNLGERDASSIIEALKAEKVPFTLEDGGHVVLVPAERQYELRLSLAGRGLPEGGGVGFEIFDKQTLGQTDFLQRLNYQRALQGELGRTIAQLGGVESARVHLALPERSLFVAEDRRPSASVVVKLASGHALSAKQIDGIVHLVASSVEGLQPEQVTVVDEAGRILTSDRRGGDLTGASNAPLEIQQTIERSAEERIESMLGAVVGREKVVARVAATLDFARVERTEESYDPDRTALRSQRTTKEEMVGTKPPGGAAGVQANLTNDASAGAGTPPDVPHSTKRDENTNFEISKIVSHTVAPVGAVKQLSVAVLIDGTYTEEGGKRTFTPRPQEEMDRLRELVKSAVGFSESRGDKVEVTSVAFQAEPVPAGEGVGGVVGRWAPAVLTRLLGVVFAAGMLLWVVRPVVLGVAARVPAGGAPLLGGVEGAVAELTQQNLLLARENPERAAQLVRHWLREGAE